jgi:CHAT domain-containing protein
VCSPELVNGAPLGVLIDAQGRTLADRFVISYTPSALFFVGQREQARDVGQREQARDVGQREQARDAGQREQARNAGEREQARDATTAADLRPTLIVGDPAYSDRDPGHWSRLSGTRIEAQAVREALGGGTLLLAGDATAARLRALARTGELARFGTLHIASHASADVVHPLESALVLAPDTTGGARDSRMSAREIANTWHIGADLVSLASCRSAVGAASATDGWSGLQSAFLIAGARSLLVSQWPADDHATTLLMHAFYGRLTDRAHPCDRAEALQAAQQTLRTWRAPDGSQPYAHPAYWATFALMGDPR